MGPNGPFPVVKGLRLACENEAMHTFDKCQKDPSPKKLDICSKFIIKLFELPLTDAKNKVEAAGNLMIVS